MNVVLERVNQVCIGVRETNKKGVTFKKLIGSIRSKFKETDFDLIIMHQSFMSMHIMMQKMISITNPQLKL